MSKFAFLLLILLVTGCQNTEPSTSNNSGEFNVSDYNSSPEDVVDRLGNIENFERFEEFKANTEKGVKDKLRIVQYTTEGDPILQELEYDGAVIKSTIDTSRDAYGSGRIYHNSCTSITVIERTDATEYALVGCDESEDSTILVMWK